VPEQDVLETEEFREAFWSWFDHQPLGFKQKYWYYPIDMAKVFFYNSIWKKKIDAKTKIASTI